MGLSHSPHIVTDGLVLCLDAANRRSYPGTGTTWYDLSGNGNHGTLTNGPTFTGDNGGGIVFDGANDYLNLPETSILKTLPSEAFTATAIFKLNNMTNVDFPQILWQRRTLIGINSIGSLGGQQYEIYTYVGSKYFGSGFISKIDTWYEATLVYNNGITQLYVNGELKDADTALLESENGFNFRAGTSGNANYANCNIPFILKYNRPLSNLEIRQNYNATRWRFQ